MTAPGTPEEYLAELADERAERADVYEPTIPAERPPVDVVVSHVPPGRYMTEEQRAAGLAHVERLRRRLELGRLAGAEPTLVIFDEVHTFTPDQVADLGVEEVPGNG